MSPSISRDEVARWVETYRSAWESGDADAVTELFTEDAHYWSAPFRDPHVGTNGVRDYWTGATGTQSDTRVVMGTPLVDGNRVAVEWWARFAEAEAPITLPGVLLLEFRGERCRVLRENWCYEEVDRPPHEGWGLTTKGDTETTRRCARSWARGYGARWRALEPEVGELYARDCVFRSAPLREPKLGRDGVKEYTRWALESEVDPAPVFAEPIVDGRSAAVEWWCPLIDDGVEVTLSGCSVQTYDDAGLVVDERDYWNDAQGRTQPHADWGPSLDD